MLDNFFNWELGDINSNNSLDYIFEDSFNEIFDSNTEKSGIRSCLFKHKYTISNNREFYNYNYHNFALKNLEITSSNIKDIILKKQELKDYNENYIPYVLLWGLPKIRTNDYIKTKIEFEYKYTKDEDIYVGFGYVFGDIQSDDWGGQYVNVFEDTNQEFIKYSTEFENEWKRLNKKEYYGIVMFVFKRKIFDLDLIIRNIKITRIHKNTKFIYKIKQADYKIIRDFENEDIQASYEITRDYENENTRAYFKLGLEQPLPKRLIIKGFDD